MASPQPNIALPPPQQARSLFFAMRGDRNPREALQRLRSEFDVGSSVLGIGEPLTRALDRTVPGLRSFPALVGPGAVVPSTQPALWIQLSGGDRGELDERARRVHSSLADWFFLSDDVECFRYREGRDLSGYVDGTENPVGDRAAAVTFVSEGDSAIQGSSFAAVQRWVHDLENFHARPEAERDLVIGRRIANNDEIADAPSSAHVKRSAQESFDPDAFMLRRSMPFISGTERGLLFVAYGESLDRYERVLRRMLGLEDGIVDALFSFSRAVTGGYYWCPPVVGGSLELALIGM